MILAPPEKGRGSPLEAGLAARKSANSRGHQSLVVLALQQIPKADGDQPLVILATKRMLTAVVHQPLVILAPDRPNECQRPGESAASHPRSETNATASWN